MSDVQTTWSAEQQRAYEKVQFDWTHQTVPDIGYRHRTCTLVAKRWHYSRFQRRETLVLTWEHVCPKCQDRYRYTTGLRGATLFGLCLECFWKEARAGAIGPFWRQGAENDAKAEADGLADLSGPITFRVYGRIERLTWRGRPVTQEDLRGAYRLIRPRGEPAKAVRLTYADTKRWLMPVRSGAPARKPSRMSPAREAPLREQLAALQQQVASLTAALRAATINETTPPKEAYDNV